MKMLGISGRLRQASLNTQLLNNVGAVLPINTFLEIQLLDILLLYNKDLDNDQKPVGVQFFQNNIREADALIFATPEYNNSIPGVLKNALDWASRPSFESPSKFKPFAILGAAASPVGGARAKADLKNVLSSTRSFVYPSDEYLLPCAHEKFDTSENLTDETAQRRLKKYIVGFFNWVGKMKTD